VGSKCFAICSGYFLFKGKDFHGPSPVDQPKG
jgi:hypothetical protein